MWRKLTDWSKCGKGKRKKPRRELNFGGEL